MPEEEKVQFTGHLGDRGERQVRADLQLNGGGSHRGSPRVAPLTFSWFAAGVALFQLALALGMPWGEWAWGGAYAGALPNTMRWASGASAILVCTFAAIVLIRAGVVASAWQPLARKLIWGVVAYCAVGVVANALTPSSLERMLWLPVTLVLLASSVAVARGP